MSDYIKRSDAVKALRLIRNCVTLFLDDIESTANTLNDLAMTADVRPNTHAKWKTAYDPLSGKKFIMMCGNCNGKVDKETKYCPVCGAIMDEEAEE